MTPVPIAVKRVGLVTAVGMCAESSCAAFRAKLSQLTETRFLDGNGEWISAHQVALQQPWRGLTKLAKMASISISEVILGLPTATLASLPLLLCVAEAERPGRIPGLEDRLFPMIESELGIRFASCSAVLAEGHVSVAVAMERARQLLADGEVPGVLIAAVDSLVSWPTLRVLEEAGRLLTSGNSNGLLPGEASGALLVGAASGSGAEVTYRGIGFGFEEAHLESDLPLKGDGLAAAVRAALRDSGMAMHEVDFCIGDMSGEHYRFKESALALLRTLRKRKESFDVWHPAECTGDVGAASGVTIAVCAYMAARKGYAQGPTMLAQLTNDAGRRAAIILRHGGA